MAFVLDVIAFSIWSESIFNVSGWQSTNTGVALKYTTTSAVAVKVIVGTITSSPSLIPTASSARWRAAVPELTAIEWLHPKYLENSSSNLLTLGPVVSQPERRVSTTDSISASPSWGL